MRAPWGYMNSGSRGAKDHQGWRQKGANACSRINKAELLEGTTKVGNEPSKKRRQKKADKTKPGKVRPHTRA